MQLNDNSNDDFKKYQRLLVRFCLSAETVDIPGTRSAERVEVYRDLIFGGFQDTLSRAYPITKRVLGEVNWNKLIYEFVASHPSSSPQLWQMPRGLLHYVENTKWGADDWPVLRDLLEFEWLEIEVGMMPDIEPRSYVKNVSDALNEKLVVNPEHQVSTLQYPVFRMKISELKNPFEKPGNYFLLTYRDADTDAVKYCELSPLVLSILDKIISNEVSWSTALDESVIELGLQRDLEHHKQMSHIALKMLLENGVILGKIPS